MDGGEIIVWGDAWSEWDLIDFGDLSTQWGGSGDWTSETATQAQSDEIVVTAPSTGTSAELPPIVVVGRTLGWQWANLDPAEIQNLYSQPAQALFDYGFQLTTTDPNDRRALEIVSDGLEALGVVAQAAHDFFATIPGFPTGDLVRFQALATTLNATSLGLAAGAIDRSTAKAAVTDAFDLAFSQATDVGLAAFAAFLTDRAVPDLGAYAKFAPIVVGIGTYIVAAAVDDTGAPRQAAETAADLVFAGIDLIVRAEQVLDWFDISTAPGGDMWFAVPYFEPAMNPGLFYTGHDGGGGGGHWGGGGDHHVP